jgi:hypothetical protein
LVLLYCATTWMHGYQHRKSTQSWYSYTRMTPKGIKDLSFKEEKSFKIEKQK